MQNTDIITNPEKEESEVIAGPYHEAFGQLVEDAVWYDNIVEKIKKYNVKVKEVEIKVNPKDINNVIGHKKQNIEKLKELYNVDVTLTKDENKTEGKFDMKILQTYQDC